LAIQDLHVAWLTGDREALNRRAIDSDSFDVRGPVPVHEALAHLQKRREPGSLGDRLGRPSMKLAIDHGGACPEQPLSVSGDRTNGTLPADFLRRRSPCDGHPVDGVVALDKDETSTDGKFCG